MFDRLKKTGSKRKDTALDLDDQDASRRKFVGDVQSLLEPHGLLDLAPLSELSRISPGERQVYLNNLRSEINDPIGLKMLKDQLVEKQREADAQQKAAEQQREIERKRSEAAAEAAKQKAAVQAAESAKSVSRPAKRAPEAKLGPSSPKALKQKPMPAKSDWFTKGKGSDHAQRQQQSKNNMKIVLDWLRLEPYSTVDTMALVLNCAKGGARKTLLKLAAQGWLVIDEIPWEGSTRKKHLFGVSSKGLFHLFDEGGVEPSPTADFKIIKSKKKKRADGSHMMNLQLYRAYMTRVENDGNVKRRWTREKYLPHYGDTRSAQRHLKWKYYPDAVIKNSHIDGLTVAIELEQIHKGSKRYKDLIWEHDTNIDEGRYDHVVYVLFDREEAESYKRLFHKLIDRSFAKSHEDREALRNRFSFDTYGDLPKRIRALE